MQCFICRHIFIQFISNEIIIILGAFGNLGFSVSKERSTTDQFTLTRVGKTGIELTVKAKSKVCVEYTFRVRSRFDEEELDITYKNRNYIGYRLRENRKQGAVTFAVKNVDMGAECL